MVVALNKTLNDVADTGVHEALKKYNNINGTSYKDVQILAGQDNHYSVKKNAGEI